VFFFRGNVSPIITCDEYPNWQTPCQILPPITPTVTIASVSTIRQGQVERIQVTVNPSPLPPAVSITLELSTISGTGEAQFISTNSATMVITQSEAVRVRGVTQSSTVDNIRITAKVTGQANILAQEEFTVVSTSSNPAITLSFPIVVVEKSYTNPARQTVRLGINPLTSTLAGTGIFTRSDDRVRFFRTAGNEITFDGRDNVFTDAELNAGVTLFAEGNRPSAALDDVQLSLTFRDTARRQIGTPVTATMTAVELTLDICESRAASGIDPPPLSTNDKINVGRFVQTPGPGFHHERAMLIVRPPNPAVFNGFLELTAIDDNKVQLFNVEVPGALQLPIPNRQIIESTLIPPNGTRFFVEGLAASTLVRDAGYRLGIVGLTTEADRVAINVVQIEVANTAAANAPATTFVRFGLWDNAFRAPGDPAGPLFNEDVEVDNFAGADTRRFHIRVHDAASRSAGHVNANWHTLDRNNAGLDNPLNNFISLIETPANSGIFISRGLMLVSDNDDRDQRTHHGTPPTIPQVPPIVNAPDNLRARGESNHRTRHGSLTGDMQVDYHVTAGPTFTVRLPVFQRNPESRRRVPLQIFVLRVAAVGGVLGNGVVDTTFASQIWSRDLPAARRAYERLGVAIDTVVRPGTDPANIRRDRDGVDSIVLIEAPAPVNPLSVTNADLTTLGRAFPALPDTIRVFYVGALATHNAGESAADIDNPGHPAMGSSFLDVTRYGLGTLAHEIGHVLTNKTNAAHTGHYVQPAAPAGNRLQTAQNLMANLPSPVNEGVNVRKRLWDAVDGDGVVNQFTDIRGSHYSRAF
jgi:hypothetical protein